MIIQSRFKFEEDGWELVRTYSSRGVKIHKIGTDEIYSEAIDPVFMNVVYEETDIPIDNDEENDFNNLNL
jgi:hypothetical protein